MSSKVVWVLVIFGDFLPAINNTNITVGETERAMSFASMRKRGRNPNQQQMKETPKVSVYEQWREERIKENLERMQKLGIFDLSLKLKSPPPTSSGKANRNRDTPSSNRFPPSRPTRRSSRLQNATPISYTEEVHLANKDQCLESKGELLREGFKPEVYTEEQEKLLGSTDMSWTPFVDGCGKDGKRIYDQIKGKTCHQCRQKTLGHRTNCSNCNMVQGQFCGDCLYMRYGENVIEAKQNPNWICPVCRGICNCSLCRQAKGWPATGVLYKKISNMGFKSVAHYLIQTKRSNTSSDVENISSFKKLVSAKRSLPFSETEAMTQGNADSPEAENKTNDDFKKGVKEEGLQVSDKKYGGGGGDTNGLVIESSDDNHQLSSVEDTEKEDEFEGKKEEEEIMQHSHISAVSKTSTEMVLDSIAGRLRQRRGHVKKVGEIGY